MKCKCGREMTKTDSDVKCLDSAGQVLPIPATYILWECFQCDRKCVERGGFYVNRGDDPKEEWSDGETVMKERGNG